MTTKLDLVSMYLSEAVGGAHRIALQLTEQGLGHYEGTLLLDPNLCSLDAFGDRANCTKMAIRQEEIEGTLMRTYDTARLKRSLISLRWAQADGRWSLIEFAKANAWYLVVQPKEGEMGGGVVVPLYSAAVFQAEDPIGTVQTRYGVPMRDMIVRGDLDEMKVEAATVRAALEALGDTRVSRGGGFDEERIADVRAALSELEAAISSAGG